ncbi:MAG: type II toxin-antitoxin system PemK/MazF family toxin [Nanoarchaeota archaeon]
MKIKRGDIILVNLGPVIGSEQGRTRPAVVLQNDFGNEYSPTTVIAPITSKIFTKEFPTNVTILKKESGLNMDSTILLNQIRTIDKSRITKRIGSLDNHLISRINLAIKVSLGLD